MKTPKMRKLYTRPVPDDPSRLEFEAGFELGPDPEAGLVVLHVEIIGTGDANVRNTDPDVLLDALMEAVARTRMGLAVATPTPGAVLAAIAALKGAGASSSEDLEG